MRRSANVAAYVVLAVLAVLLWPQRFGGTMTYDLTHGTSMQPTFHTGDLAVLRTSGSYRVGDVAAYRSPSLHTTVMHRIVRAENGRYTFKGDHNSFVDPDTVTGRALLGKLVLRVPRVGLGLAWLLNPLHLALALGGLYLLVADRKDRPAPAPAPAPAGPRAPALVVRITALRLPQELPTADVEYAEDLHALAALHGIAVLRDATTDYLMQGGLLFRHVREQVAVTPLPRRRSSPTGRDWVYDRRPDAEVFELATRRSKVS